MTKLTGWFIRKPRWMVYGLNTLIYIGYYAQTQPASQYMLLSHLTLGIFKRYVWPI
nr:hypothetical protein Q903MT_gene918 [Picea sitchensis]